MSDFPQSTWWENSRVFFPKSSIYPPYRLYKGSKVQWSVLDFVFFFKLVTFSFMCSPIKTFFKIIFSKQSVWNCFDIVMQWSPSKFYSEIAGTSWQHKQSMSLFPFQNASKYTNLYVQSCLSRHYWEKLFLPHYTHLHLYHCRFHLIHLHLFQGHNNTDADCNYSICPGFSGTVPVLVCCPGVPGWIDLSRFLDFSPKFFSYSHNFSSAV